MDEAAITMVDIAVMLDEPTHAMKFVVILCKSMFRYEADRGWPHNTIRKRIRFALRQCFDSLNRRLATM